MSNIICSISSCNKAANEAAGAPKVRSIFMPAAHMVDVWLAFIRNQNPCRRRKQIGLCDRHFDEDQDFDKRSQRTLKLKKHAAPSKVFDATSKTFIKFVSPQPATSSAQQTIKRAVLKKKVGRGGSRLGAGKARVLKMKVGPGGTCQAAGEDPPEPPPISTSPPVFPYPVPTTSSSSSSSGSSENRSTSSSGSSPQGAK